MSEKLKSKIFILIMTSLSIIVVGTIVIFSVFASGLSLIIIYLVSKKVSGVIVKPVYTTLINKELREDLELLNNIEKINEMIKELREFTVKYVNEKEA